MHNQSYFVVLLHNVITMAVWQENETERVTLLRIYLCENVTGQ